MSLRPNGLTEIPAETARVARAAFPRVCLVLRVRDALGVLFTDEQFAEWMTAGAGIDILSARLASLTCTDGREAGMTRRLTTSSGSGPSATCLSGGCRRFRPQVPVS
jgi:hypothetical protein